jgi:hypothetical protein
MFIVVTDAGIEYKVAGKCETQCQRISYTLLRMTCGKAKAF